MGFDIGSYAFYYILCEGTNEEMVINWLIANDRLIFPDGKYSLDFIRARSKEGRRKMLEWCSQQDYEGDVAIVSVCDSKKEQTGFRSADKQIMENKGFYFLPVITPPEIECLLILSKKCQNDFEKEKKNNPRLNASGYCSRFSSGRNIKDGKGFISSFDSIDDFIEACRLYKHQHKKQKELSLYDLIK